LQGDFNQEIRGSTGDPVAKDLQLVDDAIAFLDASDLFVFPSLDRAYSRPEGIGTDQPGRELFDKGENDCIGHV